MTTASSAQLNAGTPHVRVAVFGLLFGLLLSMLDGFIVGTALPTIVRQLGGAELLSWVVTAYALTTAVSTPIWGKFGDLYGRKRMFLASVIVFTAGSILVALSPTMPVLIAMRALQGIGAGGLGVGAFSVIGQLVPPRERGRYQGMTATVVAAGTIGGPLLGGFITQALGWRWAFLINLPLGVLVLVWVGLALRLPTARRAARVDWVGAATLGAAVAALVLLTTWAGSEFPWLSVQSALLAVVGIAALWAFISHEGRTAEPLLPLRVFRSRSFSMAAVLAFISGAVTFAAVLYLPLYQQTVQGASAALSGLLLLPMMVPVVIVSQVAGRIMTRTGRYRMFPIIGSASLVAGALLLATMTAQTPAWLTGCFMVLIGLGSGLTQQMTTTIAQNNVEIADIGAASGVVTLLRTLGGSVAVAVFGSVYTSRITGTAGPTRAMATASAIDVIFLIVASLAVAGLAAALLVQEVPLRGATTTQPVRADVPTRGA